MLPPPHRSGHRGSQTVSHLPGFYLQRRQDWHLNLNHSLPLLEPATCGRIRKGAAAGWGPWYSTGYHDIGSGSTYSLTGTVTAGRRGGGKKAPLLGLRSNSFLQTPKPIHQALPAPCHLLGTHWTSIFESAAGDSLSTRRIQGQTAGSNALGSSPANISSESEDRSSSSLDPWGGMTLGCSSPSPHFRRGVERPLFMAVTFPTA